MRFQLSGSTTAGVTARRPVFFTARRPWGNALDFPVRQRFGSAETSLAILEDARAEPTADVPRQASRLGVGHGVGIGAGHRMTIRIIAATEAHPHAHTRSIARSHSIEAASAHRKPHVCVVAGVPAAILGWQPRFAGAGRALELGIGATQLRRQRSEAARGCWSAPPLQSRRAGRAEVAHAAPHVVAGVVSGCRALGFVGASQGPACAICGRGVASCHC